MKILIIRFSSIGDIVLTTPIMRCIKQQKPDWEIHFLTKDIFAASLSANPYIDQLHLLNMNWAQVITSLKQEKFDCIIDLHHNLRSLRIKKALTIPQNYSFHKLNVAKWLLTNFKLPVMPDQSIVERYFDCIQPLGIVNDGQGLDYFIAPEDQIFPEKILPPKHHAGYVACIIGGSYFTKRLPTAQWHAFCAAVPYPVVLLGGPEDSENGHIIAAANPGKIYNACGKFTLSQSADLVKQAHVVVSNDTGLMHIAAAFQKPVISLWGNTSPEMGMFPYYGHNNLKENHSPLSVLLENKKLWCHPCSKLGYKKCPKKHFKCMNSLNMQDAVQHVIRLWP
jgi:heptosyltransferase-2